MENFNLKKAKSYLLEGALVRGRDELDYELDEVVNPKLVSKLIIIFDQIQSDLSNKGIEVGPDELVEYLAEQMKIYSYGG